MEPDAYRVLQVDPLAEQEVVDAAFRRLAHKYHPDVNPAPDAATQMAQIVAACGIPIGAPATIAAWRHGNGRNSLVCTATRVQRKGYTCPYSMA